MGLAPFAEEAIRALVGKDAHRNLIGLVAKDLRGSDRVPHTLRVTVAEAWGARRVDPWLGGRLVAWLATGKEEYLLAAGQRWRELLTGVLAGSGANVDELVEVTVQIARLHLAGAQATDRDALRAVAGDIKDHVTRELSQRGEQPDGFGRVRFNVPTVTAVVCV